MGGHSHQEKKGTESRRTKQLIHMRTSNVRLMTGHDPFALSPTCYLMSSDPWCRHVKIPNCR